MMKSESNVKALMAVVHKLGFPETLVGELRLNLCFQPVQFSLHYNQKRSEDKLRFEVCVQKDGNTNEYFIPFYEAFLQKAISIPSFKAGDLNSTDLEKKMSGIEWGRLDTTLEVDLLETIETIVFELGLLSTETEGQIVADLLRLKYWCSTPFSRYCSNIRLLQSEYEVSQRFYHFPNEEVISIHEAYRFLSHRWREKQIQALQRKQNKPATTLPREDHKGKQSKASSTVKGNRTNNGKAKHK